jgi:hypothetical protein
MPLLARAYIVQSAVIETGNAVVRKFRNLGRVEISQNLPGPLTSPGLCKSVSHAKKKGRKKREGGKREKSS